MARSKRRHVKREEFTMSDDERERKRKEHEDGEPDVEAHIYESDDPSEIDPEKKRKAHGDAEGDEVGRKRK